MSRIRAVPKGGQCKGGQAAKKEVRSPEGVLSSSDLVSWGQERCYPVGHRRPWSPDWSGGCVTAGSPGPISAGGWDGKPQGD